MGNVLRVLKRDFVRLLKAPAALVVVIALLILPSVYTWYNVIGFWNPYDNTSQLRVDVVNQDVGGSSELTGELHVGDMITEELKNNSQLDWHFTDFDTAMANLESGVSYAAFVIPEEFTEDLLTLTTGDFTQPDLRYYVNEKLGPVAPKITDTGASTLDETINSTFVSTVSDVAVKAIDAALDESNAAVDESRSQALLKLDEALGVIENARTSLGGITQATQDADAQVQNARGVVSDVREEMAIAARALDEVSRQATDMQNELLDFSAAAVPAVGASMEAVSQAASQANAAAVGLAGNVQAASLDVEATIAQARVALSEGEALAAHLHDVALSMPEGDEQRAALEQAAAQLDEANAHARLLVDDLERLSGLAQDAAQDVQDAAGPLDDAVQDALVGAEAYATSLFTTTLPAASESLARLSTTSASMSAALSNQQLLAAQTDLVLDQLSSTLASARQAASQTDDLLSSLSAGLETVRTDVSALGSAGVVAQLFGEDDLDAGKIASFMGSPTEVVTEQLYPLNAYGSAMAPLFMNLTFWIGAFMLLVILKQEVDSEGISNLKLWQRYVSRFALFAVFAVFQALICCAGVLLIGVQAANPAALFVAAAVASLSYLSIIYALSVTLQHIGKGLCIVLVFAQIPGATGLYPIEMTSWFFQAVYPFFPFTYGIGAMREAICGFYGTHYAQDVLTLLAFFAVFMALGLIFRPLMANVNRMVARQVREGGLFNGEDVEIPVRPYRISQIVRALSDKQDYRAEIAMRYERFTRWYPRMIRGSVVVGIAVPVVLILVFALTPAEKVLLLTVFLASFAALLVFLVVVESLRFSLERQMSLDGMTDENLRALYSSRNTMQHSASDAEGGEGRA